MEDIRSVLSLFHSKKSHESKRTPESLSSTSELATYSEIPDLFFDVILRDYKLNRHEITLFLFLYRQIWCRPSPYKEHGIGPLNSYSDIALKMGLSTDEVVTTVKNLEKYGLLESVRVGQYFIRKFITQEYDEIYGQTYAF